LYQAWRWEFDETAYQRWPEWDKIMGCKEILLPNKFLRFKHPIFLCETIAFMMFNNGYLSWLCFL